MSAMISQGRSELILLVRDWVSYRKGPLWVVPRSFFGGSWVSIDWVGGDCPWLWMCLTSLILREADLSLPLSHNHFSSLDQLDLCPPGFAVNSTRPKQRSPPWLSLTVSTYWLLLCLLSPFRERLTIFHVGFIFLILSFHSLGESFNGQTKSNHFIVRWLTLSQVNRRLIKWSTLPVWAELGSDYGQTHGPAFKPLYESPLPGGYTSPSYRNSQ